MASAPDLGRGSPRSQVETHHESEQNSANPSPRPVLSPPAPVPRPPSPAARPPSPAARPPSPRLEPIPSSDIRSDTSSFRKGSVVYVRMPPLGTSYSKSPPVEYEVLPPSPFLPTLSPSIGSPPPSRILPAIRQPRRRGQRPQPSRPPLLARERASKRYLRAVLIQYMHIECASLLFNSPLFSFMSVPVFPSNSAR
jgi:hypothetical protein